MIAEHLNTLFVQSKGACVRADHDTLLVELDDGSKRRIPLQHLGSVVVYEGCTITPHAMHKCVQDGKQVVFLTHSGRFMCRVVGETSGNVLLRLAQYRAHDDEARRLEMAKVIVCAKIRNSRLLIQRGARDASKAQSKEALMLAAERMAEAVLRASSAASMEQLLGDEGDAARSYFGCFSHLLTPSRRDFSFGGRTRRPPRDKVNAALSFVYSLVTADCVTALECVGLDPQVGMLHSVRPGRPALALDLAEELRAWAADRLVLKLINLGQLKACHFDSRESVGGSVLLNEEGRKIVLAAYQERKRKPVRHVFLATKIAFGHVPFIQALLLARHLRGDLPHYVPYSHCV